MEIKFPHSLFPILTIEGLNRRESNEIRKSKLNKPEVKSASFSSSLPSHSL